MASGAGGGLVFLTGATGFIGGRLAAALSARGHRLRCLVRRPERAAALRALGAELVVEALRRLPEGLPATPQPDEGVTYAAKIAKAEAAIDWRRPAAQIERTMRAFDPFPGAIGSLRDTAIKCWTGEVVAAAGAPGEVLAVGADGIVVACGADALRLTVLQRPGSKRLPVREFLAGFPVSVGDCFAIAAG